MVKTPTLSFTDTDTIVCITVHCATAVVLLLAPYWQHKPDIQPNTAHKGMEQTSQVK